MQGHVKNETKQLKKKISFFMPLVRKLKTLQNITTHNAGAVNALSTTDCRCSSHLSTCVTSRRKSYCL